MICNTTSSQWNQTKKTYNYINFYTFLNFGCSCAQLNYLVAFSYISGGVHGGVPGGGKDCHCYVGVLGEGSIIDDPTEFYYLLNAYTSMLMLTRS